ncbi:hypothetical protein GF420_10720 [candidate division GN15 bacterium]|nr:hypothetical protein [candidate division GN15 bacterium]
MYLTISKRFEFSASHRYYVPSWDEEANRTFFARRTGGPHGYGNNFTLFAVFHGDIDRDDGMVINVTTIKQRVNEILADRYDHKFLNADSPPFNEIPPTPENIAAVLMRDLTRAFDGERATPVVCHVMESPETGATAYADGMIERHYWLEFSAARKTMSPHLSDEGNRNLFGPAFGLHGHGYRLRVTLRGEVDGTYGLIRPPHDTDMYLGAIPKELDHRYLNDEVAGMKDRPMTTECLAQYIFEQLEPRLPVNRVRLHENSYFFAEYHAGRKSCLGVESRFHAAHRLHSPALDDATNREVYGKCNNPAGHGHLYRLETTIGGELDERSGTLYPLDRAIGSIDDVLQRWDYKHLDEDTQDFTDRPSTAENMIVALWPRLQSALDNRVVRARLWETPNNRFTLRADRS